MIWNLCLKWMKFFNEQNAGKAVEKENKRNQKLRQEGRKVDEL